MQGLPRIYLATLLLACAALSPAHAVVIQAVGVAYSERFSLDPPIRASRGVSDRFEPITENIAATISGTFGSATASVGVFGDLGIQGQARLPGDLSTSVEIFNDFIPNIASSARRAIARFVIDGGELWLSAGQGSRLVFALALEALVFDSDGREVDGAIWLTVTTMTQLDASGTALDITRLGADIGVRPGIDPSALEIPLSFQTVDLGLVPAMGYLDLRYGVSIFSNVAGFAEVVRWRYSDPLSVDGPGQFQGVDFLDPGAAVPAPATGAALLVGLALTWLDGSRRRVRRRR